MNFRFQKYLTVLGITVLSFVLQATNIFAEEGAPASVAILPFEVHAAENLAYLKQGIRDMLASRLAAGAGVDIIAKAKVDEATGGVAVQPSQFTALSQKLGSDYLIAGSFTSLGGGGSLDAKVYDAKTKATEDFFATALKQDDVIGSISDISWDIGEKMFGVERPDKPKPAFQPAPAATPAQPSQEIANYQSAHPERAYLNPNSGNGFGSPFIRPMGITGAFGFTKTQNLPMAIQAMDVGDIDGDGEDEMILADRTQVSVYHINNGMLKLMEDLEFSVIYKIHYVSIGGDINGNGVNEIVVSAMNNDRTASFVLEWQTDHLEYLYKDVPYYLRAMDLPGEGLILVGQKKSLDRHFEPGLYRMVSKGGKLEGANQIMVPESVNLFDFTMTDLDADGRQEVISIDQNDKLRVMQQSGKILWKSAEFYGGTTRFVGKVQEELTESRNPGGRYYIPCRLLVADLNNDQKNDIVVNKNLSTASRVFENLKSYPDGEIHGLAWNGISLTELWRTRKIDGYIADYQLKYTGEGQKAMLYVAVVLNTTIGEILSNRDSTVLIYPLDFGQVEMEQ